MRKIAFLAAMGSLAAFGTSAALAAGKGYLVNANTWGSAQNDAVIAAGGRVTFGHAGTGLGVVESDASDFAARLLASGVVTSVDQDESVQWQAPMPNIEVDQNAINPSNEPFYRYVQWAPQSVEAPAAWAAGYTGLGVRVAVIDGGIFDAHPDLAGAIDVAASRSFVPGQAFNQDTGTFWHGTHVAGIVAARDNAIGVVGIAPEATVVGVKALHNGSGQFGWIIGAILYSATPQSQGGAGASIINMSLGAQFPRGGGNTGAGPLVAALNKAVNYASSNGVLVVSAAGNDETDLDHSKSLITVPAESGSGIAVSATGPMGFGFHEALLVNPPAPKPADALNFRRPASYSNYGNSVIQVAAPGGDFAYPGNETCVKPRIPAGTVTIPCWAFDMVLSTSRAGYSWAAGTSMAAPAASAVAALIKQKYPGISLGALKAKLTQTADDEGKKGNDPFYGKGYVNARRAVTE